MQKVLTYDGILMLGGSSHYTKDRPGSEEMMCEYAENKKPTFTDVSFSAITQLYSFVCTGRSTGGYLSTVKAYHQVSYQLSNYCRSLHLYTPRNIAVSRW